MSSEFKAGLEKLTWVKPCSTVAAPKVTIGRGIYKTGDGDAIRPIRPGSEDFLKAPSLLGKKNDTHNA